MADNNTRIIITAEDRTQAALASVRNGMTGLTGAVGQLSQLAARIPAIGGIIGSGFAALGVAASHTISFAAGLHDMSMQTGATVGQLSALRNVAEMNGVSLEEAGKSLGKLAKNMVDAASGGKETGATFSALGVSVKDGSGKLRESGDVMVDVAKAIAGLASPTERAAAAQLVFGKSGAALVPMLMDIAKEGKLAATVTAEQAENADRFADAMTKMKQNMRGMAERIGLELVEPLADLAEKMNDVLKDGGGNKEIKVVWLDKLINTLATKLAEAQKTWSDGMAKFWRTVGATGMAGRFEAQSAEARAALERLGIRRNQLDIGDWSDQPNMGGKKTGTTFFDRIGTVSGGVKSKAPKEIDTRLYGFSDNRGAAEIMRELHAEDAALERLREKYVALIDPIQKYRDELEEIDRLEALGREGGGLTQEQALEARWRVQEKITAATEGTTEAIKQQKSIAEELGMTFTSAFEDAVVSGKKFSEVLQGMAQDIARIFVRKSVTEPMASAIGSIDWSGIFSFNADGGVYSGPGISAFSGQVVNKPTVFPFASGIGLMGEAGPEAILPLRRGSDGRLGVEGGGGSMVVNIIEAPGRGGQQRQRSEGGRNVLDVFVEQIKSSIAGDIADGRGSIPAALSGSYGLNRAAGAY